MAALDRLVEELERSYTELRERMSDPAVYNDHKEAAEVGRRLKELEGPYKLAQEWRETVADLEAARGDPELRELVEVRQGVGGDEAALWAAEVTRMLSRYAERRGYKVEELGGSPNEAGGVK